MRYFELVDDVHVPGRWHLNDAPLPSGESIDLLRGERHPAVTELRLEITHPGRALPFCRTNFGLPVATRKLAATIESLVGTDLQRIPFLIPGHPGYEALNATRLVDCLDESRSEFSTWTSADGLADLVGQYAIVPKLSVDASKLSTRDRLFRVQRWPVALIVCETVKEAMEQAGCLGAKFLNVT
jgi:hypothetical protein